MLGDEIFQAQHRVCRESAKPVPGSVHISQGDGTVKCSGDGVDKRLCSCGGLIGADESVILLGVDHRGGDDLGTAVYLFVNLCCGNHGFINLLRRSMILELPEVGVRNILYPAKAFRTTLCCSCGNRINDIMRYLNLKFAGEERNPKCQVMNPAYFRSY